jgi:hypothetical protein
MGGNGEKYKAGYFHSHGSLRMSKEMPVNNAGSFIRHWGLGIGEMQSPARAVSNLLMPVA